MSEREKSKIGFQSLFWWILLLNFSLELVINRNILVSILVLVDFALKLSFVIWDHGDPECFNPCFGGFCS